MAAKRASETAKTKRVFGQRRAPAKMFRVGLYARVSTHDQQTLPLQMRVMREYAAKRGWSITVQIKEVGSGAAERELREKLLAAARRRILGTSVNNRIPCYKSDFAVRSCTRLKCFNLTPNLRPQFAAKEITSYDSIDFREGCCEVPWDNPDYLT